ncbi:restriction endonuclease subunit S [Halomonas alkalicola]|uniref:Restriction endonuclease subunit S n=1 Tax=Halomonas alkalicola TaxID=1930622 RepID=A0ABY9H8S2_9GAMM|nr:restriction endonuclease subunit S [Halomonas alkalicola]WLI74886.1 restriction endonuclease subunit S [Halomonas alkalicola]
MIPEGWKLTKLAEGIELVSGQHVEAQYVNEEGAGEPYLTGPADFDGGKIISSKFTDFANKFCEEGDVLVTVKGSGTGRIVRADRRYAISRQLMSIKARGFDSNYLYFLVSSKVGSYEGAAAGLIPGISRVDILNADVLAPPVSEQIRIAKIISSWDEVIGVSERMLESSRKQKRALMQHLLTGKRRLPGAEGRWREERLGDLFSERNETGRDELPLLAITGGSGVIDRGELARRDTSSEDKGKYKRLCIGDIGYNTMRMWQGVSGLSDKEGLVSPAYTVVTPGHEADGLFFSYLFKFPRVIHEFYRHSQGLVSDTWNLKYRHFSEIKVAVPEVDEQKAIAKVLSQADAEIEAQQRRLDCLRQEKRALMQQLLTGKRRVKVEATVPTEEAAC